MGAYDDLIERAAVVNGVPPEIIRKVMKVESFGDPRAVSHKGAGGLMQLMPATAADLGVTDRFDPEQNVMGGAKYLRQMYDKFGDWRTALAAYNAGPDAVEEYRKKGHDIPPYPETQDYVKKLGYGPPTNAPSKSETASTTLPTTQVNLEGASATSAKVNPFEDRIKALGFGYDIADEPYYRRSTGGSRGGAQQFLPTPTPTPAPSRNQRLIEALPYILNFAQMMNR